MTRSFGAALALCVLAAAAADAQSLGDAARKAQEGRKADSRSSLVFDERDLDPDAAQEELLAFSIDDARWRRFIAADRAVAAALARDPAVLGRLQNLRATSVRALERFLQREPLLRAALDGAGADAHEYAFTQLAIGLVTALQKRPDAAFVLQTMPEAVVANVAFLKARAHELTTVAVPSEALALRIAPLPSAAAAPRPAAEPAALHDAVIAGTPAARAVAPATDSVMVEDFNFIEFNGTPRRLSDYRGRYVLLDFWGVWCPNCRAEVPYLKAAYAQFQSRGLEIIGMDYEKGATVKEVQQYLVANGITWPFARPDSVRDVIVNQFQISGFPTQILVDPGGALVNTSSGSLRGPRLAKTLDKLLPK